MKEQFEELWSKDWSVPLMRLVGVVFTFSLVTILIVGTYGVVRLIIGGVDC